ncbi:hypothetical protein RND81_07G098300 [Saponaria officinalis]
MNHVNNSLSKVKQLSPVQRAYNIPNQTYGKRPEQKVNRDEIIAKDLLRGALELQESLVMLGKLQNEAGFSSFISKSRRKQKGSSNVDEGSSFDCMVNGSRPRKSIDNGEVRKVVRESLLRQNVITNPIFEENFDHRLASSSSSYSSSMIRSSNFVPTDSSSSSISSISQKRRKRDSNLIFKLMGLESPPLSPKCHKEDKKIVRKCQYNARVLGNKQRSVEEILETLHFKGLLRSSSLNGTAFNGVESEIFSSENGLYDERPPIVVMKPYMPKFWHESEGGGTFENKTGFKHRTKHEDLRKSSEVEKVTPTRRKGECFGYETGVPEVRAKFRDEFNFGGQEKLNNPSKVMKQKDGRFVAKQRNVVSTSAYDHRTDEISEMSRHRRKSRQSSFAEDEKKRKGKEKEIDVVYREAVSTCDSNKVLTVAKSSVFDSSIEPKNSRVCRNQIRDNNVEALPEYRQIEKIPVNDIVLVDAREHGNASEDSHSCYSEITSVSTSEHYSPVCEVTLVTTHENGVPVDSLGEKSPSFTRENKSEPMKESLRTQLQTLLLSNVSIPNNSEDLFEFQLFADLVQYDVGRDRLLIDYANEVVRLNSLEMSQPYLLQKPSITKETRDLRSVDRLLEEIGNGIEELKRYHGSDSDDTFCSDSLYRILNRDLNLKNGVWEIGWRKTFSRDEFEQVVREVDRFILGKLMEEVVLDFIVL